MVGFIVEILLNKEMEKKKGLNQKEVNILKSVFAPTILHVKHIFFNIITEVLPFGVQCKKIQIFKAQKGVHFKILRF